MKTLIKAMLYTFLAVETAELFFEDIPAKQATVLFMLFAMLMYEAFKEDYRNRTN